MAYKQQQTAEFFEVLTTRPDGHQTVTRLRATSQAEAEKEIRQRLDDSPRGGEITRSGSMAAGGLPPDDDDEAG